jgi:hypothetical protein
MSTLSVRLPNSLHKQLRECAKREGTSINHLISSAVAEKLSALMTADYLEARAQRGSRRKFDAALRGVPNVEPAASARMPTGGSPPRRHSGRKRTS